MTRSFGSLCVSLLLAIAATGCDHPQSRQDAGTTCSLSTAELWVRAPDRIYRALPTDAELVLGFQGFRYFYAEIRTVGRPALAEATVTATFPDTSAASQGYRLALEERGEDRFASGPLLFFFNDRALVELVDRSAMIHLHVGAGSCSAAASGAITLRFDPACIEDGAGARVCADGGAASALLDAATGDAGER